MNLTIARVLMWQVLVAVALAAVLWGIYGNTIGYSALLGGVTCVVPNAFLALRLVLPREDSGAKALLGAAWAGEAGKLALTVLLFSLVFTLVRPLSAAALFAGFILTQLVILTGLLMRSEPEQDTRYSNGS